MHRFRRALLAFPAVLLLQGAALADGPAETMLLASFGEGQPFDPVALQEELVGLGPAALPELFALLHAGELSGEEGPRLDALRLAAVTAALGSASKDELRRVLTPLAQGEDVAERLTAIGLLRDFGSAGELGLLARLAAPRTAGATVSLAQRNAFEAALGAILVRDRAARTSLPVLFGDLATALLAPAVRATGRLAPVDCLGLNAALVGRIPEVDPLVLSQLSRAAERARHGPRPDAVLDSVREALRWGSGARLHAAALTAGKLRDADSVERLIALLEDGDEAVRAAAYGALREITGLSYHPSVKAWRSWYDEEVRWWREEALYLIAALHATDAAEASAAVIALSRTRLYGRHAALEIAHCLTRPEEDLVRVACAALGHLAAPEVVVDLAHALERPEPHLREAAHRALIAVSGLELPPDPELWRALDPDRR